MQFRSVARYTSMEIYPYSELDAEIDRRQPENFGSKPLPVSTTTGRAQNYLIAAAAVPKSNSKQFERCPDLRQTDAVPDAAASTTNCLPTTTVALLTPGPFVASPGMWPSAQNSPGPLLDRTEAVFCCNRQPTAAVACPSLSGQRLLFVFIHDTRMADRPAPRPASGPTAPAYSSRFFCLAVAQASPSHFVAQHDRQLRVAFFCVA